MLRILGSAKHFAPGVTRRDWLRVGGLGLAGLSLPEVFQLQDASRAAEGTRGARFGQAKSLILIHLYGAPSQLEWVDPKPDAPVEIRGTLGTIASKLPGCQVGELFPKFGQVLDRCTVLRSLTHPYPIHGVAFALTGIPVIDVGMELSPRDPRHWPYCGSVIDFVDGVRSPAPPSIPRNLVLPFRFSSRRVGEVPRAGPYGGFLGANYDPVFADYVGTPTRGVIKTLRDMEFKDPDPYVACANDSHFVVPAATRLQSDVTLDRFDRRRSLLEQMNAARRELLDAAPTRKWNSQQAAALAVLSSEKLAAALDIRRESTEVQELYGESLFSKSCLAARRLVEAGARVVSVFWDEYGLAGSGWDTHWNHYQRMKEELCPGLDQGWHALITDLDRRGLLDDTLVVCTSEHGRTPKINGAKGAGRDHWSQVYASVVAGGGTARGRVVGASDRHAAEVADRPLSPKDLLATMYHLLGIDPELRLTDRTGREWPLTEGRVITEALA